MRKVLGALLLSLLAFGVNAEVWEARYGVQSTFDFKLYNTDGTLDVDEADGGTEVSVSCAEGAETTATNDFVDEGTFYSITLTAAEMECQRIAVVIAATTTEVFFVQTTNDTLAMVPAHDATVKSITDGTIVAADFAAGAIDATVIAADAIGASELATDAIGAAEIATDAIAAAEIAADAIGASELATDAIGAAEVAANTITSSEIAADAITAAKFDSTAGQYAPLRIVDQGTAQSATATTMVLRSAAAFADDELIGATIVITGGTTGVGQSKAITDYVSNTDTATVSTWTVTPTGTITYKIFAEPAGSGGSVSISAGGITASSFASGAIDATAIAADAIGASELAANAITASEIADAAIDEATYATTAGSFDALGVVDQGTAQAVTGTTIQLRSAATFADDEIVGATCVITGGSTGVGQARTVSDYVSSTDTATVATWTTTPTGTITYACYGTAAGGAGEVTIAAGGISASSFQAGAIDASVIATDAIGAAEIATDAIGASEIATDAIGASELATDAVGAAEIAASAIGASEIADGGITSTEFGSGAITATVIATDAIGSAEIATDAIGAAELAADAIGSSELAADAITAAKLAADVATEIQSGIATASAVAAVKLVVDALAVGVNVEQMNGSDVCGTGAPGSPWTKCP